MGLESASHIDELVPANPAGGDAKGQGDDHIRLIKTVLQTDFPTIDAPITATVTEINYLTGVTSALQGQINLKSPIADPIFTGTPQAPKAALGTNTSQIATCSFVQENFTANAYPTVAGQSGRWLTNNGTIAQWGDPFPVPSSAYANLFLTNDGTSTLWKKVKTALEADATYTVGAGGDYSTLGDAIKDIYNLYYAAVTLASGVMNMPSVTINLLSGYELDEQLIFSSGNFSWITITSVDAMVDYDVSAFASASNMITIEKGAISPIFDIILSQSTLLSGGADNATCFYVEDGGKLLLSGGIDNFSVGIGITRAEAYLNDPEITDCDIGVQSVVSKIAVEGCTVTGGAYGFSLYASEIDMFGTAPTPLTVTGQSSYAIFSSGSTIRSNGPGTYTGIQLYQSNISMNSSTVNNGVDGYGFYHSGGSIAMTRSMTGSTCNISFNSAPSSSGIHMRA